ncbi:MAG: lactonase family protein [Anaerolineae bacterium]|nr:lactonase family protein [Anaerolineae bacterium]
MTRILKLTILLMGLLLLVTTLGYWAARAEKSSERAVVMREIDATGQHQRLIQIWPGFRRPYLLTHEPLHGAVSWLTDTSSQLMVIAIRPGIEGGADYYRVNSSDQSLTRVAEGASDSLVASSPSQHWLLVALPAGTERDYWLIHLPTARRWSISKLLGPRQLAFPARHLFANDGQWLYLTLQADGAYSVVRIDLADFTLRELATRLLPADYVGVQAQIGEWLIVWDGRHYNRVSTDGTDFGPLLEGDANDALFTVYPDDGVALIHRDNRMLAVDVATQAILWEQTEFTMGFPASGPPGWINIWQEDINLLLRVSTGETRALPAELQGPSTTRRTLFSNGRWALYSRSATGQEWWVYDWGSAKSRLLRQDMQYFRFVGVMPDEEWLLVENAAWPYGLYRLNLRDGTLEQMTTGGSFTWMGWTPPFLSTWQPFPLLFIGVLLMICPILFRLPRRWLKLTA